MCCSSSEENEEVLGEFVPIDITAKIHPLSAMGTIDESQLESIKDKRDALLRAAKKLSTQTDIIASIVLKFKTQYGLEHALQLWARVKNWLCRFSYWYWDCDYSTVHEDFMSFHFQLHGQKILEIRKCEIRDLTCDIKVMCNKIQEYAEVSIDTKGLDLILRMYRSLLKEYDKYLGELWANMYQ